MVFSSLIFLFGFLPIVLLLYFSAPRGWKNAVLFAVSLFFYGWGEPIYILLMLLSLSVAFALGLPIGVLRVTHPARARALTVVSVLFSLSLLFFFKYYNFFALNLSRLPMIEIPQIPDLRLPIGISFYTFQIISYTVDVLRGDTPAQRNYVAFGAYVTLFPQLIAGPIVRYRDVDRELTDRRERVTDFAEGVERFAVGLAKKVLIGDLLAATSVYFRELTALAPTPLTAWMTILFYSLHLYFDFSGYSDMAIGLGRMFGFHFPENFRYPAVSRSISEFWRRWHISLSTWFREYVYIPLGGNRCGKWKLYRNLAVVWLLTGFWHGANWNFLLWGAYFAVILILERAFLGRMLEKIPTVFQHLYAIFLILVGFLIFSYTDLGEALHCLGAMFGIGVEGLGREVAGYTLLRALPLLAAAIVGCTPLPHRLWTRACEGCKPWRAMRPLLTVLLFLLCVAYMVDSTFSPFEYTQF